MPLPGSSKGLYVVNVRRLVWVFVRVTGVAIAVSTVTAMGGWLWGAFALGCALALWRP